MRGAPPLSSTCPPGARQPLPAPPPPPPPRAPGTRRLDKYGKNECPKCLSPLAGDGAVPRRQPGEASTFKAKASDAGESQSGTCPKGGPHAWKFGKVRRRAPRPPPARPPPDPPLQCGVGEGYKKGPAKTTMRDGACTDGKMHIYKFSKCTKCGKSEF